MQTHPARESIRSTSGRCPTKPLQSPAPCKRGNNAFVYDAIVDHSKAKGACLAFLYALAKWANDDGVCWPGIASIAQALHCSTRTAQTLLQKLIAQKELTVEFRASNVKTNRYRICCVALAKRPAPVAQKVAKPDELPNTCTQKTAFTQSKKNSPPPDPVPIPHILKKEGEKKTHISNPEQAARSEIPPVPPPIEIQVLESGTENAPTQEQRLRWAEVLATRIIDPEAYRLRVPFSKDQARMYRNCVSFGYLPWPKPGTWLASQVRRPI